MLVHMGHMGASVCEAAKSSLGRSLRGSQDVVFGVRPQTLLAGFSGIYTVKVRTRYERNIGEFVLHCHILDHEDRGMMQNVAVVLPDQVTDPPPNHVM